MKSILLFALCALCTSHSLSGATNVIEDEVVANNRTKTKLVNLNYDCLFMISQYLDVLDLFSMAEANKDLSFVAQAILEHRFGRKKVTIELGYSAFKLTETEDEIIFSETKHLELLSRNILKNFGHLFSGLEIDIEVRLRNTTTMSKLFEQINLYCSDSLTDLHISYCGVGLFINTVRIPFKNVRNLTVSFQFNVFDHSNLSFSELFPALRNLTLEDYRAENYEWVNDQFPHLEYFDAGFINDDRYFKKLIKNNPQIKHINVDLSHKGNGFELLESIADKMPNLEHLEILESDISAPFYDDAKVESLIKLLEKSKKLKKIHLYSGWAASDSIFSAIQNQLHGWTITKDVNEDHVYLERED